MDGRWIEPEDFGLLRPRALPALQPVCRGGQCQPVYSELLAPKARHIAPCPQPRLMLRLAPALLARLRQSPAEEALPRYIPRDKVAKPRPSAKPKKAAIDPHARCNWHRLPDKRPMTLPSSSTRAADASAQDAASLVHFEPLSASG